MHPVLFRIGSFDVGTHDFFMLLGMFVAAVPFFYEARRRGMLSDRLIFIAGFTALSGVIGAKLSTVWEYLGASPHPTLVGALVDGGQSILGDRHPVGEGEFISPQADTASTRKGFRPREPLLARLG